MRGILFLTFKRIRRRKAAALTAALSFALVLGLPLSIHRLSGSIDRTLRRRAEGIPLLIGAAGSPYSLLFSCLYFKGTPPKPINFALTEPLRKLVKGRWLPLVLGFRAGGFPIVGSSFHYFSYRKLRPAKGTLPVRWGDVVLGSRVARQLGLKPGDYLRSERSSPFELPCALPVDLRVTGILQATGSPDDGAVFTSCETVWIVAGLGHGHSSASGSAPLNQETYVRITRKNIRSFHFHGSIDRFPVTGFILTGVNQKQRIIARGVANSGRVLQAFRPSAMIDEMLSWLLSFEKIMQGYSLLTTAATLALLALMSLMLRASRLREFLVLRHIGCTVRSTEYLWLFEVGVMTALGLAGALLMRFACLQAFTLWWSGL